MVNLLIFIVFAMKKRATDFLFDRHYVDHKCDAMIEHICLNWKTLYTQSPAGALLVFFFSPFVLFMDLDDILSSSSPVVVTLDEGDDRPEAFAPRRFSSSIKDISIAR